MRKDDGASIVEPKIHRSSITDPGRAHPKHPSRPRRQHRNAFAVLGGEIETAVIVTGAVFAKRGCGDKGDGHGRPQPIVFGLCRAHAPNQSQQEISESPHRMPSSSDERARDAITSVGRGQTSPRHCKLHETTRAFRETHGPPPDSGKNAPGPGSGVPMEAPEDGGFPRSRSGFGTGVAKWTPMSPALRGLWTGREGGHHE